MQCCCYFWVLIHLWWPFDIISILIVDRYNVALSLVFSKYLVVAVAGYLLCSWDVFASCADFSWVFWGTCQVLSSQEGFLERGGSLFEVVVEDIEISIYSVLEMWRGAEIHFTGKIFDLFFIEFWHFPLFIRFSKGNFRPIRRYSIRLIERPISMIFGRMRLPNFGVIDLSLNIFKMLFNFGMFDTLIFDEIVVLL